MTSSVFGRAALALAAAGLLASPAAAQGYRATIDLRAQRVANRGWDLDSLPAGDVQVGAGGGFVTDDGFAASCTPGLPQCFYFRPGRRLESAPMVLTTSATAWGFGVKGLSAHANFRFNYNLGDVPWPATEPTFQLWEGYLDYQHDWFSLRGGRQIVTSRLGWAGFDGGYGTVRTRKLGLEASGFLGWGLARSAPVGIDDPITAPLGDFIPPQRNLIAGAFAAYRSGRLDVRAEWQREVDRSTDYLMSDRVAGSATFRPVERVTITGGAEYDLAQGLWGSADASARYTAPRLQVTAGYRRYMPRFDLWSVWPAFSPVAWNGGHATVIVSPIRWLQLRGTGELFQFEEAGAETPLFTSRDDGYRVRFGGTVSALRHVTFDGGWSIERGVGGWIDGGDASVTWTPTPTLLVRGFGAISQRPLEYRYDASNARWFGIDVDARAADRFNVGLSLIRMNEERERPDAAAFDWNQTRLTARLTYTFSSRERDRGNLPDAIRRMPSMQGYAR
jgi:hypothetical protein